jgi:hypothetical protein
MCSATRAVLPICTISVCNSAALSIMSPPPSFAAELIAVLCLVHVFFI